MNTNITKITINFAVNSKLLRLFSVFALLMLVSACVTTGGNRQTDKQSCSAAGETQRDCTHNGVIEITQDIGVDPEIKDEFNTAITLLNEEKYSEAIRLLRGVTGKTSKFTAPYINLGIAYARIGEMDKAEESLKKALEINDQHPVANNELGIVYRKTGRYTEARERYELTVNTYPEFVPARKNLGVLCDIYLRDFACALEQYEEYLKRIPDDEKVKIWLADVQSRI